MCCSFSLPQLPLALPKINLSVIQKSSLARSGTAGQHEPDTNFVCVPTPVVNGFLVSKSAGPTINLAPRHRAGMAALCEHTMPPA